MPPLMMLARLVENPSMVKETKRHAAGLHPSTYAYRWHTTLLKQADWLLPSGWHVRNSWVCIGIVWCVYC